jgi:dTMP kinase
MSGLFISFEGIDGAGKSTHIEGLAKAFRAQGRVVTLTREPGGTPLAEKLRTLVLNDAMDPMTEALLVFAARRDHLQQCIEPALARGEVVLCDRFTDATFAYQGSGRGFDVEMLSILELWVQSGRGPAPETSPKDAIENDTKPVHQSVRQPDMTVWFDVSPEVAAERLSGTRVPDKFEAQPLEFFRKVVLGYTQRAAQFPQRFVRIDASKERHKVWQQITSAMVRRGWLAIMVAANDGPK